MPQFEFDPAKSEANRTKHGIDFFAAQEIWTDVKRIEGPARSDVEPRRQVLGIARGRLWSAFITYRDQAIRIVSVRPARIQERRIYEEE